MSDNLFPLEFFALAQGWSGHGWPRANQGLTSGGSPRYALYRCADGRFLAVAPLEQKFWDNLCDAIELPQTMARRPARPGGHAGGGGRMRCAPHLRRVGRRSSRDSTCAATSSLPSRKRVVTLTSRPAACSGDAGRRPTWPAGAAGAARRCGANAGDAGLRAALGEFDPAARARPLGQRLRMSGADGGRRARSRCAGTRHWRSGWLRR